MLRIFRTLVFFLLMNPWSVYAQLGGQDTYSFLDLSGSARATAVGGAFYGAPRGDLSLAISNPALLNEKVHKHLSFNTGFYLAGTNYGQIAYGHYAKKIKTTFSTSANYVSFGKFEGADPSGNLTGNFKAGSFYLAGAAARQWKNFSYGAQLKFIFSSIEQYNSMGIGLDVSAGYFNEDRNLTLTMLLRNVGAELKSYVSGQKREDLPLDMSFALSKRFEKIPLRLNLVAHHLQKWDLTRPKEKKNNNQQIIGSATTTERGVIDKMFAHLITGLEIDVAKPVSLRLGYDHLRRIELASTEKKGLTGFTAGFGISIQQFRIDYAFEKYSSIGSLNQIGLSVNLNDFGNKTN